MYRFLIKCEVKMAGYWPTSFFACLWTEMESRSEQAWSIKDVLHGFRGKFSCGTTRRVVPSGQDGAILPARDYPPCPAKTFSRKPYNKSFIDQACSAKMAGWFFCEFMDLDSVSVHKHAKEELGQYPAILTSHLVNNPYILVGFFSKCETFHF